MSNKNGSEAAFPLISPDGLAINTGLTKREHIAAMAMQGLLSNPSGYNIVSWKRTVVEDAVDLADALLKALEE